MTMLEVFVCVVDGLGLGGEQAPALGRHVFVSRSCHAPVMKETEENWSMYT